jgi:hypothetical protein
MRRITARVEMYEILAVSPVATVSERKHVCAISLCELRDVPFIT